VVKAACPDAYSFAYDDQKSTYTCNNPFPDYTITFCPNGGGGVVGGISTSAWYSVVNSKSGKCVDASWAGTANGTVVLQYACTGNQNQQWQFVPAAGGYYTVVPRYAPSLTWDVTGGAGATGNSVAVQLWGFPAGGSGANQQWMPVSLGSGLWKFVARHSGKCLDVPGASTVDNVQLQQYDCNGTGAQSFSLVQK
jgi:glucosylceramidase